MQRWIRWFGGAAAACGLFALPASAGSAKKKPAEKKAKANKERQATPKAREHASFKKARSCGAASRTCLAKCHHHKVAAEHTRCVSQAKCDKTYSGCMGKIL